MGLRPLQQAPEVAKLAEHGDNVHGGAAVLHELLPIARFLEVYGCSHLKASHKKWYCGKLVS